MIETIRAILGKQLEPKFMVQNQPEESRSNILKIFGSYRVVCPRLPAINLEMICRNVYGRLNSDLKIEKKITWHRLVQTERRFMGSPMYGDRWRWSTV